MPIYVALLRGVNVGGARKLPMAELRALVESLGCTRVSTYIQSGNVVFSAGKPVAPATLEVAIADRFGLDVAVMLRTPAQLEHVLEANPFPDADRSRLHVGFMAKRPNTATVAGLEADRFVPDEFAVEGAEVYLHLPAGMGRTKLPDYLVRRLAVPVTVRNWNTVGKLAELARG